MGLFQLFVVVLSLYFTSVDDQVPGPYCPILFRQIFLKFSLLTFNVYSIPGQMSTFQFLNRIESFDLYVHEFFSLNFYTASHFNIQFFPICSFKFSNLFFASQIWWRCMYCTKQQKFGDVSSTRMVLIFEHVLFMKFVIVLSTLPCHSFLFSFLLH